MHLTQIHIPVERCIVSASITVLNLDANCFAEVPSCMAQFTSLQASLCTFFVACIAAAQFSSFLFCFFIVQCIATIVINFSEQELSVRKNRLTVLPVFLNCIKSLQVLHRLPIWRVECLLCMISEAFCRC